MTRISFRPTQGQRLIYPAIGVILALTQLLDDQIGLAIAFLVAFGALYLAQSRFGLDLTDEALVMHGLTTRAIPWPEIERIETRRTLGTTLVRPVLRDGSAPMTRAPYTSFIGADSEFEAKVARIREFWRGHGGPTEPPPPEPPPAQAR